MIASVTGQKENAKAIERVADFDAVAAAENTAKELIPDIKANSRRDSGAMAASWIASGEYIENSVPYTGYQEYGTAFITPMNAIGQAIDKHPEKITREFEAEIGRAADKAGFSGF